VRSITALVVAVALLPGAAQRRDLGTAVAGASAAMPATPLTPAQYRADIAQLRGALDQTEKSWAPGVKLTALARLDALAAAADTLHEVYFHLEISRIVALADNGHTVVPAQSRAHRYNRVALRLAPFGQQFHVLRATAEHAALLGARLVSIDGRSIDTLRAVARTLSGGPPAWRDRGAPAFLESPQQLHALRLVEDADAATYRFERLDGSIVEQRMPAIAPDSAAPIVAASRWWYPETAVSGTEALLPLLSPSDAPWVLAEAGKPFRSRAAPDLDALVVELRATMDQGPARIRAFLDSMSAEIRARRPGNVVLDLRFNGGGDLNTTRAFVQSLPRLVTGRVFVLTSPYTFSAAISTVGYLKQAAPERVSIVGEEVGDRTEFWAEGRPIQLEQSRIRVGLATERHDYKDGCRAYADCHGNVVRNPIVLASLAPDVSAPWTIEDYRRGRDPGMEAVRRLLGR